MSSKQRVTIPNIVTMISFLFIAGTAWGMANGRASNNSEEIAQIKTEFEAYESIVEKRLAKLQEDTQALKVLSAEIANDVKWIKENQNK